MQIAIASGKGGTGKTTVAVNLALALCASHEVTLADCDVEEPNCHLFFSGNQKEEIVTHPVPDIDTAACTLCGTCGSFCRYGALIVLADRVLQYEKLCHSCGGCEIVCPTKAISMRPERAGVVHISNPKPSLLLISGTLEEGSIHTTAVIKAVRRHLTREALALLDAPPGSSCAAMETLKDCDFCLMVTEPTPFGLHDLSLIHEVTEIFDIPTAVVINRNDEKDNGVESYCTAHNLPVLMRIPFDRTIALMQGSGSIISEQDSAWRERFVRLGYECLALAGAR